jgi:hypothetical protein
VGRTQFNLPDVFDTIVGEHPPRDRIQRSPSGKTDDRWAKAQVQ